MLGIYKGVLPATALLDRYRRELAYNDCYCTDCPGDISLVRYVEAFYTTGLFRLERFILKWVLNRPSTDAEAAGLVNGGYSRFAAWSVEARADNQILMCDFQNRTRSWLMTETLNQADANSSFTRLYFGSAVVSVKAGGGGRPKMGFAFGALLGLHKLYSVLLLYSAKKKLLSQESK